MQDVINMQSPEGAGWQFKSNVAAKALQKNKVE